MRWTPQPVPWGHPGLPTMIGLPASSGRRSISTAAMNWSRSTCSTHGIPLTAPVCPIVWWLGCTFPTYFELREHGNQPIPGAFREVSRPKKVVKQHVLGTRPRGHKLRCAVFTLAGPGWRRHPDQFHSRRRRHLHYEQLAQFRLPTLHLGHPGSAGGPGHPHRHRRFGRWRTGFQLSGDLQRHPLCRGRVSGVPGDPAVPAQAGPGRGRGRGKEERVRPVHVPARHLGKPAQPEGHCLLPGLHAPVHPPGPASAPAICGADYYGHHYRHHGDVVLLRFRSAILPAIHP